MHQCKVVLDNYNGQYFPGTQIQGRVLVTLDSQTTVRGIKVRVICHEHTSWIGTESYYDTEEKTHRSRDVQFEGDNDVLSNEILLYGGSSGTTTISMGQHIYPFVIQLPPNLPSSYQCEKGSIIYKITATVDRPMALDYDDQIIIVVNSPIDLNNLQKPDLLQSSSYSDEKTICCWCCAQGPISIDVELPKKTLVPNETVEVKARVQNMSNSNVAHVSLELKQILTFKTERPNHDSKIDSTVLVDIDDSGVGAHGENTYNFKVSLPPNVTLPNFSQCRLFQAEYVYKVIAHLPGLTSNLEVKMYPEVGHIPIGSHSVGLSEVPLSFPNPTNTPYGNPASMGVPYGNKQMYPPPGPIQTKMPVPSADMGWTNPSAPPLDQPPPSYDSVMR